MAATKTHGTETELDEVAEQLAEEFDAADTADGNAVPETKQERFVRLANSRVDKALKAISNIASLANKTQYEYTSAQVNAIDNALRDVVDAVVLSFEHGQPQVTGFQLPV